jgi:hypothetical protein
MPALVLTVSMAGIAMRFQNWLHPLMKMRGNRRVVCNTRSAKPERNRDYEKSARRQTDPSVNSLATASARHRASRVVRSIHPITEL